MTRTVTATPWENWARTEQAHPARWAAPRDLAELVATVRSAAREGLRLRVVGAGHSFTGVAVTDAVLVRLDHLAAVERVALAPDGTTRVTVGGGIRLRDLNRALATCRLAMPNLGDIDHQTVAGAISTGIHGTGARLSGLASQVTALRVVTAGGAVLETSPTEHPELPGPGGLVERNDHFEFHWFPHTRRALTKRNNRVTRVGPGDEPADRDPPPAPRLGRVRRWVDDEMLSNAVFEATNRLTARAPGLTPAINAFAARALSARAYSAPSHEVFVSPRRVRFREMEYPVPRAALTQVLAELDAWIEESGERVSFPVEVRSAAADDVWLSTAHGRDTAYVAVHQYARLPYVRYFAAAERIAAAVDGRPHWGKLHWFGAERLAALYPRFEDFRAVRAAQDPGGMFTNPYTDRVLGLLGR